MALAPTAQKAIADGGCTASPTWSSIDLASLARRSWSALGISREELRRPAPIAWSIGAPLAVVALVIAGALLEPAPATEATGAAAVADGVIANVLTIGFVVSAMGAMSLRRWGIASALGVALFTTGLVVTCPLSGHHSFGLWFAGEMGCVLAATGIATAALVRTNRNG